MVTAAAKQEVLDRAMNKLQRMTLQSLSQMVPEDVRQQYPKGDFTWDYDPARLAYRVGIWVQHKDGQRLCCDLMLTHDSELEEHRLAWYAHDIAGQLAAGIHKLTPFDDKPMKEAKKQVKKPPKPKHWCTKCGPVDNTRYPEWPQCKHEAAA